MRCAVRCFGEKVTYHLHHLLHRSFECATHLDALKMNFQVIRGEGDEKTTSLDSAPVTIILQFTCKRFECNNYTDNNDMDRATHKGLHKIIFWGRFDDYVKYSYYIIFRNFSEIFEAGINVNG